MSPPQHFVLPDLGEGLADAELVAWHVAVGDEVALNQVLVEVETEKAVVELPSPFVGTVVELLAAAGETVSVGAPLIAIDSNSAATETEIVAAPDAAPAATEPERRTRSRREGADARGLRPVRSASEPPAAQRQRAPGAGPRRHAPHAAHAGDAGTTARRATRALHGTPERRRPGRRPRQRPGRDHHREDLATHLAASTAHDAEPA